jgi:hypothetical protein
MRTLVWLLAFMTCAAAAEVRTLKLATGEVLVHPFEGGVPLPAESKWSICQGAGPAFVPEAGGTRLNWNVILKAKGSPPLLRDINRATVQEVSGTTAVPIFDDAPKPTDTGGLIILAPAQIVSGNTIPGFTRQSPPSLCFECCCSRERSRTSCFSRLSSARKPNKRSRREATCLKMQRTTVAGITVGFTKLARATI